MAAPDGAPLPPAGELSSVMISALCRASASMSAAGGSAAASSMRPPPFTVICIFGAFDFIGTVAWCAMGPEARQLVDKLHPEAPKLETEEIL
jgi:hypothetical protein